MTMGVVEIDRPSSPRAARGSHSPPPGRDVASATISGLYGGRKREGGLVRVLVVDDSAEARHAARRTLEREGFLVEQAPDGAGALEGVARLGPDLVLLDLAMPGMGGLEVLARLRRTSTVPVIVLSGRDDERVRVAALNLGADDYVAKPFPTRELPARPESDPQGETPTSRALSCGPRRAGRAFIAGGR